MKVSRLLRVLLLTGLSGGTLMSASCGDIVISSVKQGLFNFVSGSVSLSLGGGQLSDFLDSLDGGGLDGGGALTPGLNDGFGTGLLDRRDPASL